MAIPADIQARITKLTNAYYNNGPYSATNLGGFDNGGHEINFFALTEDVTRVSAYAAQIADLSLATKDSVDALLASLNQNGPVASVAGFTGIVTVAKLDTALTITTRLAALELRARMFAIANGA